MKIWNLLFNHDTFRYRIIIVRKLFINTFIMSSTLFRSKQYRSIKNLKKLTISAPLSSPSLTASASPLTNTTSLISLPLATPNHQDFPYPVVVLTAKYRFTAENPNELCIDPKDYLKLLERPGNGWLKVQKLDKYDQVGLIPASYVSIAVNDIMNPISTEWLQEYRQDAITDLHAHESDDEVSVLNRKSLDDDEEDDDLFDFEKQYPLRVEFEQVLLNTDKKFWYKVKFTLSNKNVDKVYVAKFYQDFQKLHVSLLAAFPGIPLPRLPQPLRTSLLSNHSGKIDKSLVEHLNLQCEALNRYMNELISIKKVQKFTEVMDFIHNCVQVKVIEGQTRLLEDSTKKLHPGSVDINTYDTHSYFSPTEPLPPLDNLPNLAFLPSHPSFPGTPKQLSFGSLPIKTQPLTYKVPSSTSSNTLASFSSLIAGYEEEREPTESVEVTESKTNHYSSN